MKELSLKQWHHGYLGLLLIAGGLGFKAPRIVWIVGVIIVCDDLLEHAVQYITQTEWYSPLRRLYGYVYARSALIRGVNAWLDRLFA